VASSESDPGPGEAAFECRETYDEITLNADISDETFKLPEAKK
jgi:hypothetical protein